MNTMPTGTKMIPYPIHKGSMAQLKPDLHVHGYSPVMPEPIGNAQFTLLHMNDLQHVKVELYCIKISWEPFQSSWLPRV